MQSFLILINKWWTVVNSKTRFSAYLLVSAIVKDDEKVKFLQSLADWFYSWSKTGSGLCLSQQTFQAMYGADTASTSVTYLSKDFRNIAKLAVEIF